MKSLFKVTLLASTMAVAFNAPSFAAPAVKDVAASATAASTTTESAQSADNNVEFKNDDQRSAYALGASLGRYMDNSLKEQEKLGIKLDKDQLIAGVQDAFANKSRLSDQDIEQTLQSFENRVKSAAQEKMEKDAKENADKGKVFRDAFVKEKGVKKSSTGLMYKVEKIGTGNIPKDTDTVVVNYKGTLIDGKEFDNSYTRGEPLSFRLDGVIPGWTEGLKHIKKGGKIKLVIPPELAYGKTGVPGIPANSTLVFDVELLDIKSASKADIKTDTPDTGAAAATGAAATKAENTVVDAKAKAEESKTAATDAVKEKAEEVKANVNEKVESAKAKAEALKAEANAKAEEAKANANEKVESAKAKAEALKAEANVKAEEVKANANERVESAKTKAEALKAEANAKVETAKADSNVKVDAAKAKAEELKSAAQTQLDNAKNKANANVEAAAAKTEEVKADANAKAAEAKVDVKAQVDAVKAKAEDLQAAVKEATSTTDTTKK